ncbi:MAG: ArnT family glycosyltransferase [Pirellulaceae bacterium]
MSRLLGRTLPGTTRRSLDDLLWQVLVLLAVWVYLWTLHADNDGLWFPSDAPRHAINGFFWIDYLRDFSLDPKSYALSYYARYPAIDPASRPPVFYLLEGVAFKLLGPSPYVAKGLVLCFSLMAALYLMAWLREFISTETGWAAGLLLLLPGIMSWSHAIMLNVPSLALGLGALYHARRWLEAPRARRRDFLGATLLTLLGILTYYPTGVVLFVIAIWIAAQGNWAWWRDGRTLVAIGLCMLVLLPFTWLIAHWAPVQLGWILPGASNVGKLATWTYYPFRMPQIVNEHLLCLAGVGTIAGLAHKRWRTEAAMLISWILVLYVVFSILYAKDLRYALPVVVPLVMLGAIGVLIVCEGFTRLFRFGETYGRYLTTVVFLTLVVWQGYLAAKYSVTSISGFRELVSFFERVAPEEPVFYDGYYDCTFTFYMRAGDDHFRRRVVLGSKLLYAYAMVPGWRQQDFVNSPEEVIEVLQRRGGCRWLAIEVFRGGPELLPMRHVRAAVNTSACELIRSFPIQGATIERVDVYKLKLPVADVQDVELPFPILGPDVKYRVRPIRPRRIE